MRSKTTRIRTLLVLTALIGIVAMPAAAATHVAAVSGFEPSPVGDHRNQFALNAGDGLPGVIQLDLERDSAGNVSGTFTMHVVETASGARSEVGVIRGRISSGSLTTREGGLTSGLDVLLAVTSGTGRFDGISGSGTLAVSKSDEGGLAGTLSLTF